MGWKCEQSTGNMYKDDELMGSGYSGLPTNENNPDRQQVKELESLPCGTYKITGHSTLRGPVTITLKQTSEKTFERSELRIHDERRHGPADFASEGCIALSLATRRLIFRDGNDLEVVR